MNWLNRSSTRSQDRTGSYAFALYWMEQPGTSICSELASIAERSDLLNPQSQISFEDPLSAPQPLLDGPGMGFQSLSPGDSNSRGSQFLDEGFIDFNHIYKFDEIGYI